MCECKTSPGSILVLSEGLSIQTAKPELDIEVNKLMLDI